MKDRQGFGSRIKEMREYRNLTIEKAAELCDCSDSTWKQYERGERLLSVPISWLNFYILLLFLFLWRA